MLKDLNDDQLLLAELMSSISEKGYYAGWMHGLEYELWGILNGVERSCGRHIVTEKELQQLQFLVDKCGCWIIFDNEKEEIAIDLESWRKDFSRKGGTRR